MPDYPDHPTPSEDYRQLARRLRELAQETCRPYARQELLRLSGIYERRAEHLDRRADLLAPPPRHRPAAGAISSVGNDISGTFD